MSAKHFLALPSAMPFSWLANVRILKRHARPELRRDGMKLSGADSERAFFRPLKRYVKYWY
jgi:hypothetical protein